MYASKWWHWGFAPNPEEWQALLSAATLIAAVWAGIAAYGQLRAMRDANDRASESNQRAAEAEIATTRPYVIVRFELQAAIPSSPTATAASGFVLLVIENVGRTAARNMTLRSTPELQTSGDGVPEGQPDPVIGALQEKFSGNYVFHYLAPGQKLVYVLDTTSGMMADDTNLPQRYEVQVKYWPQTDTDGHFEEVQVLDLEPWAVSSIYEAPLDILALQARRSNQKNEEFHRALLRALSK
ncbi:hypothetical protein [Leucobacter sp. USHLN154]|uniref:hypothetical protein n=1 Tax=Leucobacter sp. USHLN154 TaxID=3081269 RepID=UPI003017D4B4